MPIGDFLIYHPGTVTRLVHLLDKNGVHSRQDLMEKFDVDTADYSALKGVGPVMSKLLVDLRGKDIDDWVRITGLPAFNE